MGYHIYRNVYPVSGSRGPYAVIAQSYALIHRRKIILPNEKKVVPLQADYIQ